MLACVGAVLAVPAALTVRRLAKRAPVGGPALAASVLKPLHGAAPGLAANLASTLAQQHAVLFAVRDPADPAAAGSAAMAARGWCWRRWRMSRPWR